MDMAEAAVCKRKGHAARGRYPAHPEYRAVVFLDAAANFSFLTRSTVKTTHTVQWQDGKTYPLVRLDISSA